MANMAGSGRQSVGGERSEIRVDATFLDRRSATAINKTGEVQSINKHVDAKGTGFRGISHEIKEGNRTSTTGDPWVSNIFLIPKSEQRWRLIIDLSRLTVHIKTPGFHMETPESIRTAMQPGDWVISIDLTDAYLHIPIHKRYRKYLRFTHNQTIWQFKNMPFGLSVAPWLFTMVTTQVKIMAQRQGITMHMHLDDWVIRSQCRPTLVKQTQWLLNLCMTLGLRVNFQKSELTPSQDFNFVGYRYMTNIHKVFPTEKRISNIKTMTSTFLEQDPNTAHNWSCLLGLLSATEKLVPMGRLKMSQWSQAYHSRWMRVPLSEKARRALEWWSSENNLHKGSPTHPLRPHHQIFSDASMVGWGAHLEMETVSGKWTVEESTLHINNLELLAVCKTLQHWETRLQNSVVLIASDNSTVVSYINKQGGTISRSLNLATEILLNWTHMKNIVIRARHVLGRINVLADSLSREGQILRTEWSLSPDIFKKICKQTMTPWVDLFATRIGGEYGDMHFPQHP